MARSQEFHASGRGIFAKKKRKIRVSSWLKYPNPPVQ